MVGLAWMVSKHMLRSHTIRGSVYAIGSGSRSTSAAPAIHGTSDGRQATHSKSAMQAFALRMKDCFDPWFPEYNACPSIMRLHVPGKYKSTMIELDCKRQAGGILPGGGGDDRGEGEGYILIVGLFLVT